MEFITINYIYETTPQGDLKTCQVFQLNKQTNGYEVNVI